MLALDEPYSDIAARERCKTYFKFKKRSKEQILEDCCLSFFVLDFPLQAGAYGTKENVEQCLGNWFGVYEVNFLIR